MYFNYNCQHYIVSAVAKFMRLKSNVCWTVSESDCFKGKPLIIIVLCRDFILLSIVFH